jgi:hypothetical protein
LTALLFDTSKQAVDNERVEAGDLPPGTPEKTPRSTRNLLIGVLLGAALVAIGGLASFLLLKNTNQPESTSTTSLTPTPTPTPTPSPTTKPDPTAGWKTYTNESQGFTLKYPPEATATESNAPAEFGKPGLTAIRFHFTGPDQKEGTELADGYSLSLGVFNKAPMTTIKEFADQYSVVDENVASKTALKAVTINGMNGFVTTVSGLGTFDYYFFPFGEMQNKALWITTVSNSNATATKAKYDDNLELILKSFQVH